ncbi:MAG: wax ester/triacylglycerol synthase family O-acyltransferase [Deltaproteobacteria bacterium]
MAYNFERLSAQDHSFLAFEKGSVHMHIAATQIFESGPMRTEAGGVDIAAFRRATEGVLHLIPRYRQKLKWVPLEGRPVWVDDHSFNLDYHLRHTSLPQPGRIEQLKHLSARIMSQPLDRSRPLWENWIVEGLEGGDRFAIITKIHHCMMDGSAGADLAHILLSPSPEHRPAPPRAYVPRPEPSSFELFRDSVIDRAMLPLQAIRNIRNLARETEDLRGEIGIRLQALRELAGWVVKGADDSPINGELGPHRRFDWLTTPLSEVKAISRKLGCTVNDVILTTVSGAVREFMKYRRVDPDTLDFRVSAPVSVRREDNNAKMGNQVSSWIIRLPIGKDDPLERLRAVHEITAELKSSKQALGVEMMMAMAEWSPPSLLALGARAASGPINMIVTNVPGPQIPLYLLGAKLVETYPLVPLLENTGIGVAIFSYDGKLCWGFNGEYQMVADLRVFVQGIEAAFQELSEAAAREPSGKLHTLAAAAGASAASEEKSD